MVWEFLCRCVKGREFRPITTFTTNHSQQMKRHSVILLLFALFAFGGGSLQAGTFDINQNIVNLSAIPFCGSPNLISYNGQSPASGVVVSMRIDVNHNINGLPYGSPTLPQTINNQCTRVVRYKIFPALAGVPSSRAPEAVVTKNDNWLRNAAVTNGSGSVQYDLTVGDLQGAGLTSGHKVVYIEVEYYYTASSPHTINIHVSNNGIPTWSKNNFDQIGNRLLCQQSTLVGCFNYYPCDATLSILGSIQQIQGPAGWVNYYSYTSYITGGSGNFSYAWTRNNTSAVGTNPNYFFFGSPSLSSVTLTITDNVTGCVYTDSNPLKKGNLVEATSSPFVLSVGPNPGQVNAPLRVDFLLEQADFVDVDLYDLQGRKVFQLASQVEGKLGLNSMDLTPEGLEPGVYFVRLVSQQNGTLTQKLILHD